jgi:hypothetical protein
MEDLRVLHFLAAHETRDQVGHFGIEWGERIDVVFDLHE